MEKFEIITTGLQFKYGYNTYTNQIKETGVKKVIMQIMITVHNMFVYFYELMRHTEHEQPSVS